MLDPAIENFLSERIKKKSASNPSHSELMQELDEWLPKAAKKANKLFRVSHPVKFSHPDAKNISEIRATTNHKADGFLRTGNAYADFDTIFDTSANIPISKFLSLQLVDGKSVLEHLQQDSDVIKQQLSIPSIPFAEIRQGLLTITELSDTAKTSEKIKQIYFPVDDGYQLLSILTPSGLMFKLKERINVMRFSDKAKQAREDRRHQVHNEDGFDELYNLAVIGFGGANKQNISNLNSKNNGTAYLLPSMPPQLALRTIQSPKTSFFKDSLYYKHYQDSFKALHRLLAVNHNTIDIRDGRDYWIESIAEQVIKKIWQLRQLDASWSETTNLPMAQKIWLDAAYLEQRENEDDWLDEIIRSLVDWFRFAYEKTVTKDKAIFLGDVELAHIRTVLTAMQEDLR